MNKAGIVAIVGRANVGKSSLFNAIIGRREAIVTAEAGTTRDRVTAKVSFGGNDFWLVDTAGMKSADDEFELSIQDQVIESTGSADLIIVATEAASTISEEDRKVAKLALKSRKPVILALNKSDQAAKTSLEHWQRLGIRNIIRTSATQKIGISELLDELVKHLPPGRIKSAKDRIRLSILGRPNVGKSSLFNSLSAKQQALVSPQAGTTRDVNRVVIKYHQREIEIADTAGIRRSGKIERGIEKFSVLRALAAIEQSDACLLVMDATEPNTQLDQKIAGLIKDSGKGLILAANKWDLVGEEAKAGFGEKVASEFPFVPWAPLIFTSAETGQNVTKIFDLVLDIDKARRQRFKTPELNNWLRQAIDKKEPPASNRHLPKLNYMVQEDGIDLPSFKIFGAHTKFIHWSYKRYLERQFRERWPLTGTPLKFWFIEKN